MNRKETFYDAIDGLRAYAAIGILMMHVLANAEWNVKGFIFEHIISNFGNLVLLFMIISAFSMCCGYYEKVKQNEISLEKFYSKRFAKVFPFFAVLCLLDFVISPSLNSLYEIFANLTLCFGLLPNANISVIGVGWFLGVVFVFYMLFPFFCYLISNKKRAWMTFGIAVIFHILCHIRFDAGSSNIVYSAMFFFAGGLIYLYRDTLCKLSDRLSNLMWGGISIAGIFLGVCIYSQCSDITLVLLILFSVVLVGALQNRKHPLLVNPITKFLSGISLEIYLSHMVIFRLLEKIGIIDLLGNGLASYMMVILFTLGGAIVFSMIVKRMLVFSIQIVREKRRN